MTTESTTSNTAVDVQKSSAAKRAWETLHSRTVQITADELTFGVEIECLLPTRVVETQNISIGRYRAGRSLPLGLFPDGWTAQHDGSLISEIDYTVIEIVSSPLRGLEGLIEVAKVITKIVELGGIVNRSCGLHVHVGTHPIRDAYNAQHVFTTGEGHDALAEIVRRLINLTSTAEIGLFAITGSPSRLGNGYCETIKRSWHNKLKAGDTNRKINSENDRIGRYHTLNLNPLFEQNETVEFRVFSGTLNPVKVIGYIVSALGLVERAANKPLSPQFDAEYNYSSLDKYVSGVQKLHALLGWSSSRKFGWPIGAWQKYGRLVVKNQKWNAQHFVELMSEARQPNQSDPESD